MNQVDAKHERAVCGRTVRRSSDNPPSMRVRDRLIVSSRWMPTFIVEVDGFTYADSSDRNKVLDHKLDILVKIYMRDRVLLFFVFRWQS